jgi:hypothetical protein
MIQGATLRSGRRASLRLAATAALVFLSGVCTRPLSAHVSAEPDSAAAEPDFALPESAVPSGIGASRSSDRTDSLMRATFAYANSYNTRPDYEVQNRASLQLEYSRYFLDNFFVQFNGKETKFLAGDHRHAVQGTDTLIPQAFIQGSFGKTSVRAGIQTLPWGESILAPITDEISPRDNRELFNFNLEELRLGQPMVTVDQYSGFGRWSLFFVPTPSFNKIPAQGTLYYVPVPFTYRSQIEGDRGGEYGASWKKTFASADITFMAASLINNDYALRRDDSGLVTRVKQRFSLAGLSFNYAIKQFVIRGEMAYKSPEDYNDAALRIVRRDEVDTYLGVEYNSSSTLKVGLEAVEQHIEHWDDAIQSAPRDRQSLLLTITKLMWHDDLSINILNFYNKPYSTNLVMLMSSLKLNDSMTLGLNVTVPYTRDTRSGLWYVRDQRQVAFKVQFQF